MFHFCVCDFQIFLNQELQNQVSPFLRNSQKRYKVKREGLSTPCGILRTHGLNTLQAKIQHTAMLVDTFPLLMQQNQFLLHSQDFQTGRKQCTKTVALKNMKNLRLTPMQCLHGRNTRDDNSQTPPL